MTFKNLEDKCKWFEKNFSPERMIPLLPVIIRLDGNGFSKWTKTLQKPFDPRFNYIMDSATKMLVKETGAVIGYTQSDEITLILYSDKIDSGIYQDGKKQKILSKLTGWLTTRFNDLVKQEIGDMPIANFDCRVYQVPTLHEATMQLLWRENDGTRNSIQGLAYYTFGHRAIENKNTSVMQDMLIEKGLNWNDTISRNKRGVYFQQKLLSTPFTPDEISELPKNHNYFNNPDLIITRKRIVEVDMPIFSKITNKIDVVFNGVDPKLDTPFSWSDYRNY